LLKLNGKAVKIWKTPWSPKGVSLFFFLLITGAILFTVQFTVPWLIGFDGYFHIKYSYLLSKTGFIESLPYLQFTIHKEYFRDHHLLFHYLLIPFTFGEDLINGGKIAALFFSILPSLAMYLLFQYSGIRFPSVWVISALLSSQPFLYRVSLLRVHTLSLAFLIIILLCHVKRKNLLILVVSILFVWLYDAFPLILLISGVYTFSVWIIDRRLEWRPMLFTSISIIIALVINPYFPENITSFFYNIYRTLFLKTPDIQLGIEWKPYDTWSLLTNSLPVFIVFLVGILSIPLSKRLSPEAYASLIISIVFLLLTMKSRRFIEYWPPFVFISTALIVGKNLKARYLVVTGLLLLPLLWYNLKETKMEIKKSINPKTYERAASWLEEHTSEGEIVFNADWDDFPFLFFYNHKNYYIVGLDPMYMYSYDKELYLLYKSITRGKIEQPAKIIKEKFHSRFVFLDRVHLSFYKQLINDPYAKKVYEDRNSIVFELL